MYNLTKNIDKYKKRIINRKKIRERGYSKRFGIIN